MNANAQRLLTQTAQAKGYARLVNNADEQSEGTPRLHVHGKLEGPDDDGEFYVRIGEDQQGHGSNGVSFKPEDVLDVYRQPSGIVLVCIK